MALVWDEIQYAELLDSLYCSFDMNSCSGNAHSQLCLNLCELGGIKERV